MRRRWLDWPEYAGRWLARTRGIRGAEEREVRAVELRPGELSVVELGYATYRERLDVQRLEFAPADVETDVADFFDALAVVWGSTPESAARRLARQEG